MKQELQYEIKPIKAFAENTTKSYSVGDLLVTYPSAQFNISSSKQLYALMECGQQFPLSQVSGIMLPLKSAVKISNALSQGKYKNQSDNFLITKTVAIDLETEYWYFSNKSTLKRKKAFHSLKDKPAGWESLYSINKKGTRKGWQPKIKEYNGKLTNFFEDDTKK